MCIANWLATNQEQRGVRRLIALSEEERNKQIEEYLTGHPGNFRVTGLIEVLFKETGGLGEFPSCCAAPLRYLAQIDPSNHDLETVVTYLRDPREYGADWVKEAVRDLVERGPSTHQLAIVIANIHIVGSEHDVAIATEAWRTIEERTNGMTDAQRGEEITEHDMEMVVSRLRKGGLAKFNPIISSARAMFWVSCCG